MPGKRTLTPVLLMALLMAGTAQENEVIVPHASPAIKFTENAGQWEERVLTRAAIPGGAMFVEKNGILFNFYDREKYARLHTGAMARGEERDFSVPGHAYRMEFIGANHGVTVEKVQPVPGHENFFLDSDPFRWRSHVKSYSQLWLRNLYNGIDCEILAASGGAKYNFHVKRGSDPADIVVRFEGVSELTIKEGELRISTSVNEVTEKKPYAYQIIHGRVSEVPCRFRVEKNTVTFEFPQGYDREHTLVIDPVLVFSAQIGSSADNFGMTATHDNSGNLISGGVVYSPGYPYVIGSYTNSFNGTQQYGNTDVFITKYSSTGNTLMYSTYLGGSSAELVTSLIVNGSNELCLLGVTSSTNFPVTSGAFSTSFQGGSSIGFISSGVVFPNGTDIFLTKFSSTGGALLGSTYFGGSGNDGLNYLAATKSIAYLLFPAGGTATTQTCANDSLLTNYSDQFRGEISLDTNGNIFICSSTRSNDLPLAGAFDNSLGGKQDVVVAGFSSGLNTLLFSSYLGGSGLECGNGLFLTAQNEIYVTGGTTSNDMSGTTGAHTPNYQGGESDGFISRISASGSHLNTTYIGTNLYDNSFFVQCDKSGDVYVFGQSLGNMPVQARAPFPVYSVPNTHQFISCYNNALSTKLMSTVFGSSTDSVDISPSAFGIDACSGGIHLSGWGGGIVVNTNSLSQMPLLNPTQSATTGYDFYLMALGKNASALLYGSYYGGSMSQEHVDGGTSRFDQNGILYQSVCAGCGGNDDFPISPNAWPCPSSPTCSDPNKSVNCNNGVFKLDFDLSTTQINYTDTLKGCAPFTATFTNPFPGMAFLWDFGNGDTTSTVVQPVVSYTAPGTFTASLQVNDSSGCVAKYNRTTRIEVHSAVQVTAVASASLACINQSVIVNATGAANYTWTGAQASNQPGFVYTSVAAIIANFYVAASDSNGCVGYDSVTVNIETCLGTPGYMSGIGIMVYPNPASGAAVIEADHPCDLSVLDELGRTVMQVRLTETNGYRSELTGLTDGIYFLSSRNGLYTRKFVISRQ